MNIETFLDLASDWDALGGAVQEQLRDVLDSDTMNDQNPNALKMIRDRFLKSLKRCGDDELSSDAHDQIILIDEYLNGHGGK